MMEPYVKALCADIAATAPEFAGHEVVSIFFGGGTPTMLTATHIGHIFDIIKQGYHLAGDVSVTTEANPETVDSAYLTQLRKIGFNRISFGAQSFDDHLLATIGRVHSSAKAVDAVNMAAKAGFSDINVDLMYALPYQGLADFATTLNIATDLPITHISCYALTVEESTPMAGEQKSPLRAAMPDEVTDRQMYHMARQMLEAHGFKHYEMSNWAKPGYECQHNIGYWTHRQYVGFGIGAHSFVKNRRICKAADLAEYIGGNFAYKLLEEIDQAAEMAEFMMLGLRLIDGIKIHEFAERFGHDITDIFGAQLEKFAVQNLLNIDAEKIKLTPSGIDLSNIIFAEFL